MIVVLFSGGIDSWACLNWAIGEFGLATVQPLYVDFGQVYAAREIEVATILCRRLNLSLLVKDMKGMLVENRSDGHIPLRNTLLLMLAATMPNCDGVVFGMLAGESCEDKNPVYVRLMQKLFDSQFKASIYRQTTHPFKIFTPFAKKTKAEVLRWCLSRCDTQLDNVVSLQLTVACLNSNTGSCGACISCFNRWVAFYLNGFPTSLPTEKFLEMHPYNWMMHQLANRQTSKKTNPRLFSVRQMWLKRRWMWESFYAMNKYSLRHKGTSLLSLILGKDIA